MELNIFKLDSGYIQVLLRRCEDRIDRLGGASNEIFKALYATRLSIVEIASNKCDSLECTYNFRDA